MKKTTMSTRDAFGEPRDIAQLDDDGVRVQMTALAVGGEPVGPDMPMPVSFPDGVTTRPAGGTGLDHSINRPALPTGTPLRTLDADPDRVAVEIINIGPVPVTIVRDDGSSGNGGQHSIIPLAAAESPGEPGGSWPSTTFRGRIRVYGPSNAIVSFFED